MVATGSCAEAARRVDWTEGGAIFAQGDHRWIWLGAESDQSDGIGAHQYLVQHGDSYCLLDPGSVLDFSRIVANLARFARPEDVRYLFYSHQDPDVASAMPMWAAITPARVVVSRLWSRFVPHYGDLPAERVVTVLDEGGSFDLGGVRMQVIPAHYLHSAGNIALYDPVARYLFTADIGAALMPEGEERLVVEDFDRHVRYMLGFHRRYMASRRACRAFVDRVSDLPIDAIVPQHGAIFTGRDVERFLDWFGSLECGVDLLDAGGRP